MTSPLCRRDFGRAVLLFLLTLLIWLGATGLWQTTLWQIPAAYEIDALETLARLRLTEEQGWTFLLQKTAPRLGAPFTADWSTYPTPDAPVFWLFGRVAHFIGLIPASHLALLFAHASATLTFYFCSRALGHRAIIAAGAALLFGFSFSNFYRGLAHFSFTLSFMVPPSLLVAWLVGGSQRVLRQKHWQAFCLATAALLGTVNPYFGFMFAQLLGLALLYQVATARRRENLLIGSAGLGIFALVLIATNLSAAGAVFGDATSLLARNYAGSEIYGLRPIELFVPSPAHRLRAAAELGQVYGGATALKGELFGPYLGLIGSIGLGLIIVTTGCRLVRQRLGLRPAHAPAVFWITAFSIVGGLNSGLALAGLDLFRAGNRYSLFLLSVALLALAAWGSRHVRRWNSRSAALTVLPLVCLGLWDQIPVNSIHARQPILEAKIESDRALARTLEAQLPAGSLIFELPAVPFLEQPPFVAMTDYELFRPWLFTRTLRFSYGLLATDGAYRWHRHVGKLPVPKMREALEAAGFAAIYFHRAAYADRGEALRQDFLRSGLAPIFESGDHVVFRLHPTAFPRLPDLSDPSLLPRWDAARKNISPISVLIDKGWFRLERKEAEAWRWAGREASLILWNPLDRPQAVRLRFATSSLSKGNLDLSVDGRIVWRSAARSNPPESVDLPLELKPGVNRLVWSFAGRLIRPSGSDRRLLGFRVMNLAVEPSVAP
ncbi:MAG: hypothetical protein PHQ04_11270 [Opitutaceae bacterium]|nr:hypothetical protein [Opitutaceae bacterium]